MKPAPIPSNEEERLKSLSEYHIMDTLPEDVYDNITKIASEICGTPIALLTLVDENRQWIKSSQGTSLKESSREESFCAHAIIDPYQPLVVQDARYDERFHDNPLTTGEHQVVFYAGVPIVTDDGHALGSLCVIDNRPREITDQKLIALQALAKSVNAYFELRKVNLKCKENDDKMVQVSKEIDAVADGLQTFTQQHGNDAVMLPYIDTLQKLSQKLKGNS